MEPLSLAVADAGEVLTLQRAAYVTEAQAHGDLALPPLTQAFDEVRDELSDPSCTAWGFRESGRLVASLRVHRTAGGEYQMVHLAKTLRPAPAQSAW